MSSSVAQAVAALAKPFGVSETRYSQVIKGLICDNARATADCSTGTFNLLQRYLSIVKTRVVDRNAARFDSLLPIFDEIGTLMCTRYQQLAATSGTQQICASKDGGDEKDASKLAVEAITATLAFAQVIPVAVSVVKKKHAPSILMQRLAVEAMGVNEYLWKFWNDGKIQDDDASFVADMRYIEQLRSICDYYFTE